MRQTLEDAGMTLPDEYVIEIDASQVLEKEQSFIAYLKTEKIDRQLFLQMMTR